VFNIVTGYLVLDERVSLIGAAGIFLVVCGAWLLNLKAAQVDGGLNVLAPFRAIARERGSRLMLATAAIYSLTSVISKAALLQVTPAFFGPFYFVTLGLCTTLVFASRNPHTWRALGRNPWVHLAIGTCMAVMVVAHFHAIEQVEVAYMVAVKRTSLLFGMLYGAWLFKEQGLSRNLLAGGFMVAGVFLIAG
jgi:drug/metabolite transporter (DMT)-like permease